MITTKHTFRDTQGGRNTRTDWYRVAKQEYEAQDRPHWSDVFVSAMRNEIYD
jgi:hypothetical protein